MSSHLYKKRKGGPATEQGGLTTLALEAAKVTVGGLAVKAGATAGEVSGAFLIPTALATSYDAQARCVCQSVSGANNSF